LPLTQAEILAPQDLPEFRIKDGAKGQGKKVYKALFTPFSINVLYSAYRTG